MNDDELLGQLTQQRAKVSMAVPVEQIIRRGRTIRARRRGSRVALLAAAAVAAIVVLVPFNHSSGDRPGVRLAAWTVVRRPDGLVDVTIRQLRDPAGLQRKLRADGVPASVIFNSSPTTGASSCQSYGHAGLLQKVVAVPSMAPANPAGRATAMAIRPSALPPTVGIQIITNHTSVGIHLVIASRACTG